MMSDSTQPPPARENDFKQPQTKESSSGASIETTYLRSFEGILRMIAIACATVGLILIIIDLFSSVGGVFFFIGFWFIVYCVIVIVIETCIPNIYFHRLIDAVIMLAYAALWFLAAILNVAFAGRFSNILLGVASATFVRVPLSVFLQIFAFACGGLSIAIGILCIRTWKTHGEGKTGSAAIF